MRLLESCFSVTDSNQAYESQVGLNQR